MKVAVPEHQGRIAPVFDTCRRLLVFVDTGEGYEKVSHEDWSGIPRASRPAALGRLQIDLLICGGISCWMEEQIRARDIALIPWLAGFVPEILTALRDRTIDDPRFAMPGSRRCRARRRMGFACRIGNRPLMGLLAKEKENART